MLKVAPHAGALVETRTMTIKYRIYIVAPHAGALVETYFVVKFGTRIWSRLTQAR